MPLTEDNQQLDALDDFKRYVEDELIARCIRNYGDSFFNTVLAPRISDFMESLEEDYERISFRIELGGNDLGAEDDSFSHYTAAAEDSQE